MGCDIHFYVEKNVGGEWTPAVRIIDQAEPGEAPDHDTPFGEQWYHGRNYDLFSILADVRNGYGFAGLDTGEGFVPIAQPRGIPADASPEYKAVAREWDCDGHSHSWVDLEELLTYDWTQTTTKRGWVDLATYEDWTRCEYWGKALGESPRSYSGEVSGGRVEHLTNEEMDAVVADYRKCDLGEGEEFLQGRSLYTQVSWETPYFEAASDFWVQVMPRLISLANDRDVENLRIVFFFDN